MPRHPSIGCVVVVVTGVLVAAACGDAYSEREAPAGDGGPVADGAGDGGSPTQNAPPTFGCGTTSCIVGAQACCSFGGALACVAAEDGCAKVDGGADGGEAGVPDGLTCTSYTSCAPEMQCCYSRADGSACAATCGPGEFRLCHRESDGCGVGEECGPMIGAPAQGIGQCRGADD